MSRWRVDKYSDRPGLYALFDPTGGIAKTGTQDAMIQELRELEARMNLNPTTGPTQPEVKPADYDVGDTIVVLFWHDHEIERGRDAGYWDIVYGSVISVGREKICYELIVQSFPARWGGDAEASPDSLLRTISRRWVFKTAEAAKAASTTLVPPNKK